MTIVVLVVLGYLALVSFVMALMKTAARADAAVPHAVAAVEVLEHHEPLGRVAADVRHLLGAERVTVILGQAERRDGGLVVACMDAPGMLGARVPVASETAAGVLQAEEAAALGLPGGAAWSFAHIPLDGPDGVAGAVCVAARRPTVFSGGELERIEQLARRGAPVFERRRRVRTEA